MSISLTDKFVREQMLKDYISRRSDSVKKADICLSKRNSKLIKLNKTWNFQDKDGTLVLVVNLISI